MKTKSLLVVLVAFIVVTFAGCKKYDDGPTISPWPKKMRLANTWKVEEYIVAGFSTSINTGETYQYKGNGDYIVTSGSSSVTGSWEWGDKKESVKTTLSGITSEAKILRLTSSEFWISEINGNAEIHYVSAK